MAQQYKNTTGTSCVYDAFLRAGLPVEERMKYGITTNEIVGLLEKHGWEIFYKGAVIPAYTKNVLVIRDYKKDFAHIEFHEFAFTVLDYPAESIGAVAVKRQS